MLCKDFHDRFFFYEGLSFAVVVYIQELYNGVDLTKDNKLSFWILDIHLDQGREKCDGKIGFLTIYDMLYLE